MALKKPQPDQKGLRKLPTHVRNKMGYMESGGTVSDAKLKMMRNFVVEYGGVSANTVAPLKDKELIKVYNKVKKDTEKKQSGGMIGSSDMSAKKISAPKKKKMPQYYMGGGMIKKGKTYAYGGGVRKPKYNKKG